MLLTKAGQDELAREMTALVLTRPAQADVRLRQRNLRHELATSVYRSLSGDAAGARGSRRGAGGASHSGIPTEDRQAPNSIRRGRSHRRLVEHALQRLEVRVRGEHPLETEGAGRAVPLGDCLVEYLRGPR